VIGWHFWVLLQEISANSDCVTRKGIATEPLFELEHALRAKYLISRPNAMNVRVNQRLLGRARS
jgi:hypothetical protein